MNRQTRYENTPLHRASQLNNTEAARMLIGNGAYVNLINDFNRTPLELAGERSEVERLLLQFQESAS